MDIIYQVAQAIGIIIGGALLGGGGLMLIIFGPMALVTMFD